MTAGTRLRTAAPALVTAIAVAAAAVVWHHLPEPLDVYGPLDVPGAMGERVSGRAIEMTVTGVRIGPRAQRPSKPPVPAVGEWVVVDAELSATSEFVKPNADLRVGPNTYIPSDRFLPTPLGTELAPEIEQRGSWVFDVAPDLLDGSVPVTLRVSQGDGRLDSRLVVSIPITDARHDDPVALQPVRVGS
ncbi:MAG TPA: hypothetical protein VIQ11_21800 [Mycobacterium sp.]